MPSRRDTIGFLRIPKEGTLPDGVYAGYWSGKIVVFQCGNLKCECETQISMKLPRTSCNVTVHNGKISITIPN
jgi:hypothetical protein